MRQTAVVLLLALGLLASPAAATPGADAIAFTAGTGLVAGIACWTFNELANRKELPNDGFDRRGWLVGVGASYGLENFKDAEESALRAALQPFAVTLDGDGARPGFNARAGYRCNRYFSSELEVEWISRYHLDLSEASQGKVADVWTHPLFVSSNLKGYLPLGRFQPFGLVGLGTLNVENKTKNSSSIGGSTSLEYTMTALRLGGGVDLYATRKIVVSVDTSYVLPISGNENFEYLSIGFGLQYRF